MSKWMYTHRRKLKAKTVLDLLLPGTHDSGMCLGCRSCYSSIPINMPGVLTVVCTAPQRRRTLSATDCFL
jgi:hypothetical protein